jgi:hypothetical protein
VKGGVGKRHNKKGRKIALPPFLVCFKRFA